MLTDHQMLRYSSNLLTEQIGETEQLQLLSSRILLIGLGGLGSPACHYLAASGVGHLTLVDHDKVSISNLQRQILYNTDDVGLPKVSRAAHYVSKLNPDTQVTIAEERATEKNIDSLVAQADLVLDCTDNRETRYLINNSCYRLNKPLVSAAARGFSGQIIALKPDQPHGCYQCLYPTSVTEALDCSNAGIAGPVVGIMGCSQALLALRYLTGKALRWGYLDTFNGLSQKWQTLYLPRATSCPTCGGKNEHSH